MHHAIRRRAALPVAAATLILAAAAVPAAAQQARDESDKPSDGDWSLMFTIFEPDVETNLGVFRMIGDRINVGVEVDLSWSDGEQENRQSGLEIRTKAQNWNVLVGPSIRWYGDRMGPVSPYLRARVAMGKGGYELDVNEDRRREEESVDYQATLGIGAEWYPISRIGIGGHTGIQWVRRSIDLHDKGSGSSGSLMTQNVRTFRSGLVINFYFR